MAHEPEFLTKIKKIINFFRRTDGSGFLFCVCDSNDYIRDAIHPKIYEEADRHGLTLRDVFLSSDNRDNFVRRIREKADRKPDGLLIINFGELVRLSDGEALREINFARELLIGFQTPMLFWLDGETASAFANQASDLFLRRDRSLIEFSPEADSSELAEELNRVLAAIHQQESMRGSLPDDVIEITLGALRRQRDEIRHQMTVAERAGEAKGTRAGHAGKGGIYAHTINAKNVVSGILMTDRDSDDPETALRVYREVLVNQSRHLPLRGIDLGASDPGSGKQRMDLAKVYIGLDTQVQVPLSEEEKKASKKSRRIGGERESRPLSTLEAAGQNRRMVLLGDPGSGKSTFVNHLALCFAAHAVQPSAGWLDRLTGWPPSDADLVPIVVILRDFARWLPETECKAEPSLLWDFIAHRLEASRLGRAAKPLHDALEEGNAMLLLDGLDEIPGDRAKALVKCAVEIFADRYRKSRFLVTCRVLSYQNPEWQLEGFPSFELAPFNEEKIGAFISAWYAELFRLGEVKTEAEAQRLAERLRNAVRRPDLWRMAPNPLLLTVMALVHAHRGRLPQARAMLYEETVDILLWRWDELKAAGEETLPRLRELLMDAGRAEMDLKAMLWKLAFDAHGETREMDGEGLADIKEWRLLEALSKLHPKKSLDWARQVIDAIKMRAGLLLEREPGIYSFPHRTFQEYLAGAHLSTLGDFVKEGDKLADEGAFWREVILLAVGRLVYMVGDVDKPLNLVRELCPRETVDAESSWRKAWLAGEVLLEMGLNRVRDRDSGRELMDRVPNRLAELLRLGRLGPVERVEAGNVLGKLGDPRFRSDAWHLPDEPLLGFVEIPAGPFIMGSDKGEDPDAQEGEMYQHRVDLQPLFMARYPVTVAQFRTFVENSGYLPKDPDSLRGIENHPVVWVSWHEAMDYCRWLTDRLREWEGTPEPLATLLREKKWRICLPSEAEWEKASRGENGRIYPWNGRPEPDRANYNRTGIGEPSPVGCFPRGKSPFDCFDMAGNVWEWTRSLKKEYPYNPNDGRENEETDGARVLRGGGFSDTADLVRCAYRDRNYPASRDPVIGFRCVCAPNTSGL
jgi:formylglycine-generating enzyme required for sulfatase activity